MQNQASTDILIRTSREVQCETLQKFVEYVKS